MKIQLNNQQTTNKLDSRKLKILAGYLITRMLATNRDLRFSEISIAFTDDTGIAEVHSTFLGKEGATDVISFCYDPAPGDDGCCGEIVVNVQRAVEQGPKHGGSSHELALYIAHGIDHLSGADDASQEDYLRMRRRELRWLRDARQQDMLTRLVE